MEAREYQVKAKASVKKNLDSGTSRQLMVMATGTGKTYTATTILKHFSRCLWITHTEELIDQSAKAICSNYLYSIDLHESAKSVRDDDFNYLEFLNGSNLYSNMLSYEGTRAAKEHVGIIKAERMDTKTRIVVASIQTLWRRLDKLDPEMFDIVIVDEAHMAAAKTWTRALNHFKSRLRLGLTATPKRTDNMPLGNLFDDIVFEYNIENGISDGYLCELDAKQIRTNLNLDSVRTTAGELNQKDLRVIDCKERNDLIVDKYEEYAEKRPTIAFCVDVQHAMNLCQAFENRGHKASFVVGDKDLCPDRAQRIRDFKNGKIDIMINVMVLTMGFDYPELSCVIMACPTKSLTKFMQIVGRGTRLKKNYADCLILDIVDVTKRHKLINTWTLDKGKVTEKKLFKTKKQKDEIIAKEKAVLESKLTDQDTSIDLFEIPEVKIDYKRGGFRDPATQKQLDWIASLGYDVINTTYTKGMASEIISSLSASEKQINTLRSKGYKVDASLTKAEADACFDDIAKRRGELPGWKKKRNQKLQESINKL